MSADAPALADVERRFYELVTAPEGVAAGLGDAGLDARELDALIVGDERLSAVERLDLYANMYFYRIHDVLANDYPKLRAIVGEAEFHNLATDYLLACRPSHPSIRNAGDRLPAFLDEHRLVAARPWLGDLARLERARLEVFDAADANVLAFEPLRATMPDAFAALPLRLIPAHVFVDVRFSVEDVWRALEENAPSAEPAAAHHRILVWRRDPLVYHRALDRREAELLALLETRVPFERVCERLAQEPDAERVAFELLARWIGDGLLRNPLNGA